VVECTVIGFHHPGIFLMEKIGDYSENPIEGSYNDVPITSISRSIEIDLRQMLD
jgi:putative membrane protein